MSFKHARECSNLQLTNLESAGQRARSKKDETSEEHVRAVLKQLAERGCDLVVECSPSGKIELGYFQ